MSSLKGELIKLEDWGLKKLSYEIRKNTRGHYFLIDYLGSYRPGPGTGTQPSVERSGPQIPDGKDQQPKSLQKPRKPCKRLGQIKRPLTSLNALRPLPSQ